MGYVGNSPTANFASVTKDEFSGDGTTTAFTLSKAATTNGVAVFVENVRQEPTTAYAVSGTTLTFTAAPVSASGNNIYVLHHNAPASTANHPAGQDLTAVKGTFTSTVDITDTTDASDATGDTGALRTEGGASIAKKLYVGTDLDVDGTANLDVVDIDGALTQDGGNVVFNEAGADVDFRVESNAHGGSETHAFFIDGEDGDVSFGTADDSVGGEPSSNEAKVSILEATANKYILSMRNDNSSGNGLFMRAGSSSSEDTARFCGSDENNVHMLIRGDGDIYIGNNALPSTSIGGAGFQVASNNRNVLYLATSTSSNTSLAVFINSNGQVGGIKTSGSATAFNTSSDYRLKENVNYSWDATTRLKQLKPARFNFKKDADTTVDGFLAHEVSSIVPEAISGEKDETQNVGTVKNKDGKILYENVEEYKADKDKEQTWTKTGTEDVYQQIDQSKLVPLLVKTIQELEARVTALEEA